MQNLYPRVHFVVYLKKEFQPMEQLSETDISFTDGFRNPKCVLHIIIEIFKSL